MYIIFRCGSLYTSETGCESLHHNQLIRYQSEINKITVMCVLSLVGFIAAVGGRISFDIKQCLDDTFLLEILLEI